MLKFHPKEVLSAALLLVALSFQPIDGKAAAQTQSSNPTRHAHHVVVKPKPKRKSVPSLASTQPESQLEILARGLHDESTVERYNRLAQFATQHARTPDGARAALALGYFDFMHGDY